VATAKDGRKHEVISSSNDANTAGRGITDCTVTSVDRIVWYKQAVE